MTYESDCLYEAKELEVHDLREAHRELTEAFAHVEEAIESFDNIFKCMKNKNIWWFVGLQYAWDVATRLARELESQIMKEKDQYAPILDDLG